MDFYSSQFPKTHFIALPFQMESQSPLEKSLHDVYKAIDDRKNAEDLAKDLGLKVFEMREFMANLWRLGLIAPVEVLTDKYIQLLKSNYTIYKGSGSEVEAEEIADKMRLNISQIPVSRIEDLVEELAGNISDSDAGEKFRSYMLQIAPGLKEFNEEIKVALKPELAPDTQAKSEDAGQLIEPKDNGYSQGRIKRLLDLIIARRSKGNPQAAEALRVKFALKGINPDDFSPDTADNPVLLKKLQAIAKRYGIEGEDRQAFSAGKIKLIIDSIITQRSGGDPSIARALKTKLVLKGIDPDHYSYDKRDDPGMLAKVINLAYVYGVSIGEMQPRSKGKIKLILDAIIINRSKGNPAAAKAIKSKFLQKGLDPDRYSFDTPDNLILLKKLEKLAKRLGVAF